MPWTKEDKSFKTLIDRRETSSGKAYYEEVGDSIYNLHVQDVWTQTISSTPATAISQGVAELRTLYVMTEDTSVGSQQCYYAGLEDWISEKYGSAYRVKLYQNTGEEIFLTDASQWFFDYQTGIITFNGSTAGFNKPFKITGYRYIGSKGPQFDTIGIGTPATADKGINIVKTITDSSWAAFSGNVTMHSTISSGDVIRTMTFSTTANVDHDATVGGAVAGVQISTIKDGSGCVNSQINPLYLIGGSFNGNITDGGAVNVLSVNSVFLYPAVVDTVHSIYLPPKMNYGGVITNNWCMYASDTASSSMKGKLTLGSNLFPAEALDVTGNIRGTGNVNASTYTVGGVAGIDASVALFKLTPSGSDGTAVFTKGLLTAYTPPT